MHTLRNRTHVLILLDMLAFEGVYWASVAMARHSSSSPVRSFPDYIVASLLLLFSLFAARFIFSVYHNVWRYANSRAYLMMVHSDCIGGGVGIAACYVCNRFADGVYFGIWQNTADRRSAVFFCDISSIHSLRGQCPPALRWRSRHPSQPISRDTVMST